MCVFNSFYSSSVDPCLSQQLGDSLGKGAFGQVYRERAVMHRFPQLLTCILTGALNWATGETVAVKEIQLSNIPKGELGQIMVRYVLWYVAMATDFCPCLSPKSIFLRT